MTDHKRKRRDGGRSAKIASIKKSAQIEAPRFLSRKIPCYELLSEEELVSIEEHADWILQEVGIEFWGDDGNAGTAKSAYWDKSDRSFKFVDDAKLTEPWQLLKLSFNKMLLSALFTIINGITVIMIINLIR